LILSKVTLKISSIKGS